MTPELEESISWLPCRVIMRPRQESALDALFTPSSAPVAQLFNPSKLYTRRRACHKCESQFPTATFALKSFFGLLLRSCVSAAWALHRAHLSRRAVRSFFEDMECGAHCGLLPSHRHPSGCYSVCMHFRFHDANGEVSPAKSIS